MITLLLLPILLHTLTLALLVRVESTVDGSIFTIFESGMYLRTVLFVLLGVVSILYGYIITFTDDGKDPKY